VDDQKLPVAVVNLQKPANHLKMTIVFGSLVCGCVRGQDNETFSYCQQYWGNLAVSQFCWHLSKLEDSSPLNESLLESPDRPKPFTVLTTVFD